MTDDELAAIRARDTDYPPGTGDDPIDDAARDRRDLLAEVDRLRSPSPVHVERHATTCDFLIRHRECSCGHDTPGDAGAVRESEVRRR